MTSIQICANPVCREPYNADKVKLGGYCSHECRVDHQRAIAKLHPPVPPATWRERPAVLRRNGKDNRA